MSLATRTTIAILALAATPAVAAPLTRVEAEQHARAIVARYAPIAPGAPDCFGPAGDPAPGSQAWNDRDTANQYCATERLQDEYLNPAFGSTFWAETPRMYAEQNLD